jgi:hypothetical protein
VQAGMSNPKVTEPSGAATTKMYRRSRFLYATVCSGMRARVTRLSTPEKLSAGI